MRKAGVLSILFVLVPLAVAVIAEAQQTGKIAHIGFLDSSTASGSAVLLDAFWQEMHKLGWIEGKNITIGIGLPSKSLSACLSLRRTWFVLRLI